MMTLYGVRACVCCVVSTVEDLRERKVVVFDEGTERLEEVNFNFEPNVFDS
jgi:hypothetical protein